MTAPASEPEYEYKPLPKPQDVLRKSVADKVESNARAKRRNAKITELLNTYGAEYGPDLSDFITSLDKPELDAPDIETRTALKLSEIKAKRAKEAAANPMRSQTFTGTAPLVPLTPASPEALRDVERTGTSLLARAGQTALDMVGGVMDNPSMLATGPVGAALKTVGAEVSTPKPVSQFRAAIQRESNTLGDVARTMDQETLEQGGIGALAAQKIGVESAIMAGRLQLIKSLTGKGIGQNVGRGADWLKGAKDTAIQAAKMAAFTYGTTPGTPEEKAKAAGLTFAYMATPAFSSLATSDAAAIIADIGLNTGISMASGAWDEAIGQAKSMAEQRGEPDAWKKYLAVTLSPTVLYDVAFSLGTRAANGDSKARAAIQQIEQRASKVSVPTDVQGKAQAVQSAGEQKIATADVLPPIKAGTPEGNARLEQIAAEQARIDAENARAEEEAAGAEDAPPAPKQPTLAPTTPQPTVDPTGSKIVATGPAISAQPEAVIGRDTKAVPAGEAVSQPKPAQAAEGVKPQIETGTATSSKPPELMTPEDGWTTGPHKDGKQQHLSSDVFKPKEGMVYRVVSDEAFDAFIKAGRITDRAGEPSNWSNSPYPHFALARGRGNHGYIIEVPVVSMTGSGGRGQTAGVMKGSPSIDQVSRVFELGIDRNTEVPVASVFGISGKSNIVGVRELTRSGDRYVFKGEQAQAPRGEQAADDPNIADYKRQIASTGVAERPDGSTVRINSSDAVDGKFDVIEIPAGGNRSIISDPQKPMSLEEAQAFAVKAASEATKPSAPSERLVSDQPQVQRASVEVQQKPTLRLTRGIRASSDVAGQKYAAQTGSRIAILRGLNKATGAYPGETFDRLDPNQIDEVRDYLIAIQRQQKAPSPRGIDLAKLSPQDAARVAELQRAFQKSVPARQEDEAMRAFDSALGTVDATGDVKAAIESLPRVAGGYMKKRAGRMAAQEARTESVQAGEAVGRTIEDAARLPSEQAEITDAATRMTAVLAKLPESQRNAFQAVAIDGEPLAAYAKRNGLAVSTVQKRVEAARAKLQAEAKKVGVAPDTGESLRKKGARLRKSGFVAISSSASPEKPHPIRDWLRIHLLPSQGVDPKVRAAWIELENSVAAGRLEGRFVETVTERIIKRASKTGAPQEQVRSDMVQVVRGDMTPNDFAAKYGMTPADVSVLSDIRAVNEGRQDKIAKMHGLSDAMRQTVKDAVYYQTRQYERWIMGDSFEVKPEDYQAAINLTASELASKLDRFGVAATKATVSKRHGVQADAKRYLDTGDERIISGLPPTRQKAIRAIRKQMAKYQDFIDSVVVDASGNVTAEANADAIASAAKQFVDYHLSKESRSGSKRGGIDITNWRHRVLDEVWRKLYGEITDPAYTSAKTVEVQSRMLAESAFFNMLAAEGRGKWWHELPAPGRRQLGSATSREDMMRYGELAGKWVDEPTYRLLHGAEVGSGLSYKILDALYFKPMATMRLLKLFGPKTILRNYATSYTGFALGSGDAFLPTYFKHAAEAHKILAGVARGDPASIKKMQALAEEGVYRSSVSSITQDMAGLKNKVLQKAGNAYAYIDFPAKYAAYMARIDAGMTPKQAAKHVADLYQNRDAVPLIISQLGKSGALDYFGYTYDSARISVNQAKFAAAEAKAGRLRPAIGFLMSHGIQSMILSAKIAGYSTALWSAVQQMIAGRKNVNETKKLEPEQLQALRTFMPDYYDNASHLAWSEVKGDGEREVYYTVVSGQTAWPLDDLIISSAQAAQGGGGLKRVGESLLNYAGDRAGLGMFPNAAWKAITGEDIGGKYETKGIIDSMRIDDDPERFKIVAESAGKFLAEVYGGQPGQWVSQMYDYAQRKEYREKQLRSGAYINSNTPEDIIWGRLAPVRTYRITSGDMERMVKSTLRSMAATSAAAKAADNEPARLRAVEKARGVIANAKSVALSWIDDAQYVAIVQDAGFSVDEAKSIVLGGPLAPYQRKEQKSSLERQNNPQPSGGSSSGLPTRRDLGLPTRKELLGM